jgi:glycerate kinase
MKIVIATDSFKGSLSASDVCGIISGTISEKLPFITLVVKPMADGGEGTAEAMMSANNGQWIPAKVTGPLEEIKVEAGYVWFDNSRTALVEMAKASGMMLLKPEDLDPFKTTTYGTGELVSLATAKNPRRILLAIGGSATVDAGVGAAMALGWKFLDESGNPIGLGGGEIKKIKRIIPPDEKMAFDLKVLSDVDNTLFGPAGAAEVFGPQKGATPEMVKELDGAMRDLSRNVKKVLGIDIGNINGGGAAGGLGAGAVAFMNGKIVSGITELIKTVDLEQALENADWVITGEGSFDVQSLSGKVVSGISKAAKQTNTKVAVIAGNVTLSKKEYKQAGIEAVFSLKKKGMTTKEAIENCKQLLEQSTNEFINKYLN